MSIQIYDFIFVSFRVCISDVEAETIWGKYLIHENMKEEDRDSLINRSSDRLSGSTGIT